MAGRTSPAGQHLSRGSAWKQQRIKGGSAGNLTVTGIEAGDPLYQVLGIGKMSGTFFLNTTVDYTSQFTPGAALINNTGGSDTSNWLLLVSWEDVNG